jgi:hypothetical protein
MHCALQLLPAGILWGAGTAAGEIPPYFVSFSAAKLGSKVRYSSSSITNSPMYAAPWMANSVPH